MIFIYINLDISECQKMMLFVNEKITYFQERKNEKSFDSIMLEIIKNKWWGTIVIIFTDPLWCQKAYIRCKNFVPKEERWDLFVDVYVKSGFNFPKHLIDEILPYRPTDYLSILPSEYDNADYLTIYRTSSILPILEHGCLAYENKISEEISWTISPCVALYFYNLRMSRGEYAYFYKGIIRKKGHYRLCFG